MEVIDETQFFEALCYMNKDLKHISIEWQEDKKYYNIMAIMIMSNKPCSFRMSRHERENLIKQYETKST